MTVRKHEKRAIFAMILTAMVAVGCGGVARKQPSSVPQTAPAPAEMEAEEEHDGEPGAGAAPEQAPAAEAPSRSLLRKGAADDDFQRLVALSSDLDQALQLSAPDCTQAGSLRDQICNLSQKICDLARRNPGEAELSERCGDARARCQRAADRVGGLCPE